MNFFVTFARFSFFNYYWKITEILKLLTKEYQHDFITTVTWLHFIFQLSLLPFTAASFHSRESFLRHETFFKVTGLRLKPHRRNYPALNRSWIKTERKYWTQNCMLNRALERIFSCVKETSQFWSFCHEISNDVDRKFPLVENSILKWYT